MNRETSVQSFNSISAKEWKSNKDPRPFLKWWSFFIGIDKIMSKKFKHKKDKPLYSNAFLESQLAKLSMILKSANLDYSELSVLDGQVKRCIAIGVDQVGVGTVR